MGFNINVSYQELKKDIKNIGIRKILLILLILFIFFIVGSFSAYYLPWIKKINLANVNQKLEQQIVISSSSKISESDLCEGGVFKDKLDDWIINYYNKPDKDDFYCPRSSSPFLSPDIWYKNSIPTSFKSLEINYQLKNKNDSIIIPPSFIFSIDKILRFYIPENNYRIAGFEKITKKDTGYSMERDEVQLLDEPIEYGTETELKVRITIVERNKVVFYFNLKYISASSGRSIEKGFSYEVNLPKPSPESDISKLKIGFGTFKEGCVKPISYKFCY